MLHFGIMVRDEAQLEQVREKLTKKYKLKLERPFRCDVRDPWGNRVQVVDLHDESLVWLLPYAEVQQLGITFDKESDKGRLTGRAPLRRKCRGFILDQASSKSSFHGSRPWSRPLHDHC